MRKITDSKSGHILKIIKIALMTDGVFIFNAVMSIYITLIYIMRKNLTCFPTAHVDCRWIQNIRCHRNIREVYCR